MIINKNIIGFLLLAALIPHNVKAGVYAITEDNPISFEIQQNGKTETYWLHRVAYRDLTSDLTDIADKRIINHSMVEKNGKLYIAKNTYTGEINVYDAITLEDCDAIYTDYAFDSKKYTGQVLLTKDDDDNLFAFYEPVSGQTNNNIQLIFEPLDFESKDRVKENLSLDFKLDEDEFVSFTAPVIDGTIASKNFHVGFGVCYQFAYDGNYKIQLTLQDINIQDGVKTSETYVETRANTQEIEPFYDGYFERLGATLTLKNNYYFWTSNGHAINIWFRNINNRNNGSLKATDYNYDQISNGVNFFDYDGNTFLIYGKDCSPNNISFGLSVLHDELEDINYYYDYSPTSTSLTQLAAIDIKNNINTYALNDSWLNPYNRFNSGVFQKYLVPLQLSQVANYGDAVLLHTYVPGVALATYQINKNEITTGLSNILSEEKNLNAFKIIDKTIFFDKIYSNVDIFDISGKLISHNENTCQIDLHALSSGFYLINNGENTHKLNIK